MRKEILRNSSPKDELINQIIEIEWAMFDKVNNAGGRASCQDDEWTFYAMRYSQFSSFSADMLNSYREDLHEAISEGRNVITEKYGYMMEFTEPAYFDKVLRSVLPSISPKKDDLVDRIANILIGCEQVFEQKYPALASKSRPLRGNDRDNVSFHIYTIGELKTYSEKTLECYYSYLHQLNLKHDMENPSFAIHRVLVDFYGYASLEDAEIRAR